MSADHDGGGFTGSCCVAVGAFTTGSCCVAVGAFTGSSCAVGAFSSGAFFAGSGTFARARHRSSINELQDSGPCGCGAGCGAGGGIGGLKITAFGCDAGGGGGTVVDKRLGVGAGGTAVSRGAA